MQLDDLISSFEEQCLEHEFNWKIVREQDGLAKQSKEVMWVEWDTNGRFKAKYDTPAIGRSLIMSPFTEFYTWQTTEIVNIIEQRDDYIKFQTKNSNYILEKIK
jgi:hypothetical protein